MATMAKQARPWLLALLLLAPLHTGGSCGSGGQKMISACTGDCDNQEALTAEEIERVIGRAIVEAQANGVSNLTVAVVDRVNNVLAVYQSMPDPDFNPANPTASSYLNPLAQNLAEIRDGARGATGLDGIVIPNTFAAISKAGTSSFFTTQGNAFSTRTTSQVVQENFNPNEENRAAGPLYGVQIAQLPCNPFSRRFDQDALLGPKRLPVGFAADTGAVSLVKDDVPVGAVAIEFDGVYDVDLEVIDRDVPDLEERIATAAALEFEATADRRAENITIDGRSLRFADDEDVRASRSDLESPPLCVSDPGDPRCPPGGGLVPVVGWFGNFNVAVDPLDSIAPPAIQAGVPFTSQASGVVLSSLTSAAIPTPIEAEILDDGAGNPVFRPGDTASTLPLPAAGGLSAEEVAVIAQQVLRVAERTRAQARLPVGTSPKQRARIDVAITDVGGNVLGVARSRDALVDGISVVIQKAQTVAFLSSPNAANALQTATDPLVNGLPGFPAPAGAPLLGVTPLADYVTQTRDFFLSSSNQDPDFALADGVAYSTTAVGALAQPFFPPGQNASSRFGPFSKRYQDWSIFSTGLQLETVLPGIALALCAQVPDLREVLSQIPGTGVVADDPTTCLLDPISEPISCSNPVVPGFPGGIQPELASISLGITLFPGGFPIYRLSGPGAPQLIGGVGVSGDGVEQNDLIAFLGLHNAGVTLGGAIGNAVGAQRVDAAYRAPGNDALRIRYAICAVAPFNDSNEQSPCDGK
jgi:uncharacterized protein GlcG (DUF336 family)